MADKTRIPYAEAKVLADEVVEILSPYCARIEIAGSIRRKCVTVGDIEIVCIPLQEHVTNMFGEVEKPGPHMLYKMLRDGIGCEGCPFEYRLNVNGQKSFGQLMMLLNYKKFALDIFCTDFDQWAVTYLIRTGSAAFSKSFAMRKSQGGRLGEFQQLLGWRIVDKGTPLDTPTELSVFVMTGNNWIEPEDRNE